MEIEIRKVTYHAEIITIEFPYFYCQKDTSMRYGGPFTYGKITNSNLITIDFYYDDDKGITGVDYFNEPHKSDGLRIVLEGAEEITEQEFQEAKIKALEVIKEE